jgi:putative transposase
LDLFSRFIVGWAVRAVNDRQLRIKALEMALKRRCPEIGLLHHSDLYVRERGLSAAPRVARHRVQHEPARQLSRQCGDGELFLEREKRDCRPLRQLRRGQDALFDYIELFYNQRRRHSTLGQISTAKFEKRAARRVDPWKTANNAVSYQLQTHHHKGGVEWAGDF